MPTLANQSNFTFQASAQTAPSSYTVTSVIVEAPQPEIVNMTAMTDSVQTIRMVKTGAYVTPGRIALEGFGTDDPKALVGQAGDAVFSMAGGGSISRFCIVDSARLDGKVGDVFRVSITLMPTDEVQANS